MYCMHIVLQYVLYFFLDVPLYYFDIYMKSIDLTSLHLLFQFMMFIMWCKCMQFLIVFFNVCMIMQYGCSDVIWIIKMHVLCLFMQMYVYNEWMKWLWKWKCNNTHDVFAAKWIFQLLSHCQKGCLNWDDDGFLVSWRDLHINSVFWCVK